METLQVRLFGGLEVRRDGRELPSFPTRKSASLFTYLVLQRGRCISRDTLCGEMWGDQRESAARKNLRTSLWRIRTLLEPEADQRGHYLRIEGHRVGFRNAEGVSVDAWDLGACGRRLAATAAGPLSSEDLDRITNAVGLYEGDLLEGEAYDDWLASEADRLRLVYLALLERLVAHHRAVRAWRPAIELGQEIVRRDPLREHAYRDLMTAHLALGDRPLALRQYERCVEVLAKELDIEPMAETRQLHDLIRSGAACTP